MPNGITPGIRPLRADVGVSSVPGPHHIAFTEYRSAGAVLRHSPRGDSAHRHPRRPRLRPRAAHCFPVTLRGTPKVMTDDRTDQRAADLLPEERAAGSDDPQGQAAAI